MSVSNYCRFNYNFRRLLNRESVGRRFVLGFLMFLLLLASIPVVSIFTPIVLDVNFDYKQAPLSPSVNFYRFGNLVEDDIVLFDVRDLEAVNNSLAFYIVDNELTNITINDRGLFIELWGTISLFFNTLVPVPLTNISITINVTSNKVVLMDFDFMGLSVTKQLSSGSNFMNFSIDPFELNGSVLEEHYIKLSFKSSSDPTDLVISDLIIESRGAGKLVPVYYSYRDVYGRNISSCYFIDDGNLFIVERFYLALIIQLHSLKDELVVFVPYNQSYILIPQNSSIIKMLVGKPSGDLRLHNYYKILDNTIILNGSSGILFEITAPVYEVHFDIENIASRSQVESIYVDDMWYGKIPISRYLARHGNLKHWSDQVYFLLVPGKHNFRLEVTTSLEIATFDGLHRSLIYIEFELDLPSKSTYIYITLNLYNILGFSFTFSDLMFILGSVLILLYLVYDYIKYRKISLKSIRKPNIVFTVLILASTMLPSIIFMYYRVYDLSYFSNVQDASYTYLFFDTLFIFLYKTPYDIIYRIQIYLLPLIIGLILALIWLVYPLIIVNTHLTKEAPEFNTIKKSLLLSLITRSGILVVFLLLILRTAELERQFFGIHLIFLSIGPSIFLHLVAVIYLWLMLK